MLGEDHSLVNEFPSKIEQISTLNQEDPVFAKKAKRYHELDKEIRKLEMNNAPIDDESLHQLKLERADLKDSLYQQIMATA